MADENDPVDREDIEDAEVVEEAENVETSEGADEIPDPGIGAEADKAVDEAVEEPAPAVEEAVSVAAGGGPSVAAARFPPILEEAPGEEGGGHNLDLLMDVAVPITAEIGRADLPLADVLRLGTGSVVELDKSADEPVDILVNGKLLATGEVVVVGDRFGVRILDVVDRPD
jgi:flagellar motor switch protein FliN/FliY